MQQPNFDFWRRVKYSFYATLIFILITNPILYQFTELVFQIKNPALQYFFHVFLFFMVSLAVMMFPRD
jgi:Na+-translocating ferredoxin:NAD+ oxidoreductase RnfA subunit